ncbi:hypothetical protein [Saccharothrix stipae]
MPTLAGVGSGDGEERLVQRDIAPGASVSIGFQAAHTGNTGNTAEPTSFTPNGATCGVHLTRHAHAGWNRTGLMRRPPLCRNHTRVVEADERVMVPAW